MSRGAATTLLAGVAVLVAVPVAAVMSIMLLFAPASQSASCSASASGPASAGGVPQSMMPIYSAAAGKYRLGADGWAYLAALEYAESTFGANPGGSPADAYNGGLFQFEPGTWATQNADPSTPPGQHANYPFTAQYTMNPVIATFSAANYLSNSGAPGSWASALKAWNNSPAEWAKVYAHVALYTGAAAGTRTVPVVAASSCAPSGGSEPVAASGYVNPLPDVTVWQRTDMGVDADMPAGAPILAPSAVKIINILPGWYSGQPLVYWQLLSGSDAGQYQYVAEEIDQIAQPGTVVPQGGVIARFAPSGTGIEYGWATASGQTLAAATTGYTEGEITPAGSNMRAWLNSLGAHAGPDTHGSCAAPCS